ncbi:MAG: hypothetical protein ACI85J_000435, partial [Candidatus Poriferisodalaceae bacterium]
RKLITYRAKVVDIRANRANISREGRDNFIINLYPRENNFAT